MSPVAAGRKAQAHAQETSGTTVREWIARRGAGSPPALVAEIDAILGSGGDANAEATPTVCIDAAVRELRLILAGRRFKRDSAQKLLAIDALATFAFEYAGENGDPAQALQLSTHAMEALGRTLADTND